MGSPQMALDFNSSSPSAGTLNQFVLNILSSGDWFMPFEICEKILRIHRVRVSDSSLTARLRDLRKDQFGGHVIELRRREGSRAYEYRLGKGKTEINWSGRE